jgi:multisubunit Na+/H+ antiporter MnhC subunit
MLWIVFILNILLALGVGIYGLLTSPTLVAVILTMIGGSGAIGLIVATLSVACKPREEVTVITV